MPSTTATRIGSAISAIVALVALAGCAGPQAQPGQPADPAPVVATADCLAQGLRHFDDYMIPDVEGHDPAPEAGAVPTDFPVVEAVLCEGSFGTEIDGEQWSAVDEIRYDGDFTALLDALAQPSDASTGGPCTADYEMVPELWLVADNGEAVRAAWPRDSCGKTKPGVRAALDGLEVVGEETIPVAKIEGTGLTDSCLTQLPPGGFPTDGIVSEGELGEPIPGSTFGTDPGGAADLEC